jgi:hypothetical protein
MALWELIIYIYELLGAASTSLGPNLFSVLFVSPSRINSDDTRALYSRQQSHLNLSLGVLGLAFLDLARLLLARGAQP